MNESTLSTNQAISYNKQDDRLFFNLMQKVGSMGRYQIFNYVLWCAISYLIGGIVFSIPFLFYQNDYQCDQTLNASSCYDFVCSLAPSQRVKYIVPSPILSMIDKYGDNRCPSELQQVNWAISGIFSGVFFGMFKLIIFGNYFGRKTLSIANLSITCVGVILTVFSTKLLWGAVGMFLANLGIMASFNINFYFITQIVSQKYRQRFSAQIQVFYGIGATSNVLWFYLIGNFQYILLFCYAIPSAIIIIFMLIYVKQTPMMLIIKQKKEKVLEDFKDIAKFNKKSDCQLNIADIEEIKIKYQKILSLKAKSSKNNFNALDLFKYKSLRSITITLTILVCSITFIFMAPTLLLSEFNFSIFTNGIVIQSSQIIAYILACFIIPNFKRKTIAFICFTITFICSFLLIFIWDQTSTQRSGTTQKIIILILVFLIQLTTSIEFASFYVYFNEIYPTQVRVLGTGLVASASGVLYAFAHKLIELCYSYNFKVMIVITASALVCLICSYLLPQTFGKIPAQLIQELTTKSNEKGQSLLTKSIGENEY